MRLCYKPLLVGALLLAVVPAAFGQQEKRAQTGMKFLSLATSPRGAAMADALTAVEEGAMALYYNPAAMARQTSFGNVAVANTQLFVDIVYNLGTVSLQPAGGRYGTFGFTALYVDYGEMLETIRADNEQGFEEIGTFAPWAMSFGAGYAKALTDRFSVGGHVKYVQQKLGDSALERGEGGFTRGEDQEGVVAFDFGVMYQTGFRSLTFAVAARNFSPEVTFEEESFELPLTVKIGVAMDLMDLMAPGADRSTHSFLLAVDAETPRDYEEQLRVGGEYTFLNTFMLRAGYVFPADEQGISAGVGVRQSLGGLGFGADYAYTHYGILEEVHRLALHLSF